ncbi:PO11 protein, partial [Pseudoatta argentina]
MALALLTANIGGPGERRRRLYATAVMSVVLYGAPIWAQTVSGDRGILRDVRRLQRQLALRIIRGYRTVSHESAAILSGMVPFDIVADRLRRSYLQRRMIIVRDGGIAPRVSLILAEMERRRSVSRCCERLVDLPPGHPGALMRGAFVADLGVWTGRAHGALTYRITQVLTGHGVFESYLHKIGRRKSPICLFCRAAVDTAAHTLLFCPA